MEIGIVQNDQVIDSGDKLIILIMGGLGFDNDIYSVFYLTEEGAYIKKIQTDDTSKLLQDLRQDNKNALVYTTSKLFDGNLEVEIQIKNNDNQVTRFLRHYFDFVDIIERTFISRPKR